jgi:DNA-binding NarL/FixJ family response regulator
MDTPNPINNVAAVWIVGGHPLAADYLLLLLSRDPLIKAQWIRYDLLESVDLGANPTLIVDNAAIGMPAVEYIRHLNTKRSCLRYLLLDHALHLYTMLRLLSVGVQGFVPYEQVPSVLQPAIRTICSGGMWVDSNVLQQYMHHKKRERTSLNTANPALDSLTAREDEILNLARRRLSNKEIASILSIQVSTVKFHLSNIFSKLQITSRSDLWRSSEHLLLSPSPIKPTRMFEERYNLTGQD